ncbi:MAG TPA: SdrD B-like domain-containing protein, partial [Tepidisphaeraceae bacterium]|nr:SdrD B-like domain-containing protein [Tepidisphaeraceae bacterium]
MMERLEGRCLLADTGSIAGHIWWDTNGNGLQDPGEPPRVSGMVFLDANSNGTFDPVEKFKLSDATGNYKFTDLTPGNYTVRHLIPNDSVFSYPMAQSQFNIELNFAQEIPEAIRIGVQQAADRWMKIIIGDLPDEGAIDDVKIDVQSGDLPLNILATGGPDQFRTGTNLPYHGVVTWANLSLNESTARATEIAMHEIAHVLGFGTLWQTEKLIETQIGAPVYTGQAALAMYKFAVDATAKGVPVEPDPDDSAAGTHWASSWAAVNDQVFDVMASKLSQNETGRFISTVTIAAMADLGYQVNFSQGDLDWPT